MSPHWQVLTVSDKGRGWIRVLHLISGLFAVNLLWDVHVHFDCPARTKGALRFCLFRRCRFTSVPRSFFELFPFFVASLVLSGHFEVQNAVLRDRRRTSDNFWSARQAWHFLRVARMLAGLGQHERWILDDIFVAFLFHAHYLVNLGDVLGRLKFKISFCENFVIFSGDMMMILRGRRSTVRILTSLAHPPRHFVRVGPVGSLFPHFVRVRQRGANFYMAGATFSAACACQIALVEVWCDFSHRSCEFVHVRSLSLWRGAEFIKLILWDPGHKILSVLWNVFLRRSCKSFMVQS